MHNPLIIPVYHTVESNHIPTKYLISTPHRKKFKEDMSFLLKEYQSIPLSEILDLGKSNNLIKKPSFHLTFDDGFSDNYEIAMNFLKQNKIDATFFIVKDFVDNKDMFYRNKACLIINHLESNENKRNNKIVFDFLKSNKMFTNSIRLSLLNIKHSNKIRLNEIANLIHLDFQEYLQTKKPYMSSDQIHDLVEAGFSIGAHSVDHPYLQEMNESDQLNQIRSSIEFVRNTFDIPYKAFAAPFNDKGLKTSFINMLLEKGYIDMFFGTQGLKNDKIHRSYQRIEMDGSIANIKIKKAFKGMISKSFMLRLIGENQVHR